MKDSIIHFENDSSFKINYKMILNKSYKMLEFIDRSTQQFNNLSCLKTLYCSVVRSSIELDS